MEWVLILGLQIFGIFGATNILGLQIGLDNINNQSYAENKNPSFPSKP